MRWQLLDRIVECEPGKTAVGIKCFSRSEIFFMDHFPGFPIVPGVLQIEMMAQMAGKCIAIGNPEILPVLGSVKNAKFYKNIIPGDQCFIRAQITKVARQYGMAEVQVEVEGIKVSSAEILFGFVPRKNLESNSFDAVTTEWLKRQALNETKKKSENIGKSAPEGEIKL
jgi:3-hydroxyacyl-[acyl-carrier-protein] dehydratase